ncbi:unnamed protein product [Oikopleura dioica]|uniref:Uncharacterized protein n=1 Tax=Oikopleura dioica TaxID=34765 RepID=E4XD93_OIKDI|nr:unnamed protein product [Oikopleura dioica]
MSFLSTNEHSRQQSSPMPQSEEDMGEAGKKINAIFQQITQTIQIYNVRMRNIDARRKNMMASLREMGIDNLDTRPLDRHLQINVKKGKQSVYSEPIFLQTNVIKAIFMRDDAKQQASVALKLQLSPRIKSVVLTWEIYHSLIRKQPSTYKANFEFSRKSPDATFVCPILTERIDYERLLEEEKFHIDLHLKVRGVTLFKNDDEEEIVSAMMDSLAFMTKTEQESVVNDEMAAINEALKFLH